MSAVSDQAVSAPAEGAVAEGSRSPARRAGPRGWLMRRLLLVADLSGLILAFALGVAVDAGEPLFHASAAPWEIAIFVASLPLWIILARL